MPVIHLKTENTEESVKVDTPHLAINIFSIPEEEGGGHVFEEYVSKAIAEKLDAAGWKVTLVVPDDQVASSGWRAFFPSISLSEPTLRASLTPPRRLRPGFKLMKMGFIGRLWERVFSTLSFRLFGCDVRYFQPSKADNLAHRSRVIATELSARGIDLIYSPSAKIASVDIPYVITVWDLQHRLQPWFPEVAGQDLRQAREENYSRIIPRASGIVCGTQRGCSEVSSFYDYADDNLHVIPMPYAPLPQSARPNNLPSNIESEGYLFYPAQLWKHKNHLLLIETIGQLKRQGKKIPHLVATGCTKPQVAGPDPDCGSFNICESRARELEISEYVHWLGFVSRPELSYLYEHAKALAFVSWFGPDNIPPLEAFSKECPVIAADVPGVREQLQDACQYIDPASVDSLVDAILKLDLMPESIAEMVGKGKSISATRGVVDYARNLENTLKSVIPACVRQNN
jgi:glycosyltransferase involved in cell wall biosynthesis